MIKHGGIVFAMAALVALTGCSAPTEVESAPATVTVTASAEAQTQAVAEVNPHEGTEKNFYEFVLTRASAHGVDKDPSEKAVTAALHAFCEDGKPFNVSKSKDLNDNLDAVTDPTFCDLLANESPKG